MLAPINQALDELAQGRMIVVVDDEDRLGERVARGRSRALHAGNLAPGSRARKGQVGWRA